MKGSAGITNNSQYIPGLHCWRILGYMHSQTMTERRPLPFTLLKFCVFFAYYRVIQNSIVPLYCNRTWWFSGFQAEKYTNVFDVKMRLKKTIGRNYIFSHFCCVTPTLGPVWDKHVWKINLPVIPFITAVTTNHRTTIIRFLTSWTYPYLTILLYDRYMSIYWVVWVQRRLQ